MNRKKGFVNTLRRKSQHSKQWLSYVVCLPITFLASCNGLAEEVVFELNSSLSSIALTAFGYRNYAFVPTSTRDTQTMPLGGTITLDVTATGNTVESVDFVSLEFNYLANLENPTKHKRVTLFDSPEDIPAGTEIEVHLPFNEELAAGNPVPRFAPTLSLNGSGGGTETGTNSELQLTNAAFQFVGSGQYFNLPPGRDSVFVDGWPMDYGPYPTATPFPSMIPGTEFIPGDPPNTNMSPAPVGPNILDGSVTAQNGILVFNGSLLSMGVGGAGILQTAQIHEATIFASTAPLLPGDFNDDGTVNAADYVVWLTFLGSDASLLANDIDGSVVDSRQYNTWKENFGLSSSTTSIDSLKQAVPEPASSVLLGTTLLAVFFCRSYSKHSQYCAPMYFTSLKGTSS